MRSLPATRDRRRYPDRIQCMTSDGIHGAQSPAAGVCAGAVLAMHQLRRGHSGFGRPLSRVYRVARRVSQFAALQVKTRRSST